MGCQLKVQNFMGYMGKSICDLIWIMDQCGQKWKCPTTICEKLQYKI